MRIHLDINNSNTIINKFLDLETHSSSRRGEVLAMASLSPGEIQDWAIVSPGEVAAKAKPSPKRS